MPCPPGEWLRDGACIPAGVPPDGCAAGFIHDGNDGCEPVLPSEPCGPGLMAIPGETACREVAPCAAGVWGDIPVESDTEYVDASYAAMDSDGSALKPWTKLQDAVSAASSGAIVAIAQGSYAEDVVIADKSVRLWGVCPAQVEIVGSATGFAAVQVRTGAAGTEVRGLALQGAVRGLLLSGSLDVLLERVRVHETGHTAVALESIFGPSSITLRGSLVEQSRNTGVYVFGADATIEESVIRDTQPNAQRLFGRGLGVETNAGTASTVVMRSSVIERTHENGIYLDGSSLSVEASVIRDTLPDGNGYFGRGVNARSDGVSGVPATFVLRGSVVAQNGDVGVFAEGSDVTIEDSVIRDTHVDASGLGGWGLSAQLDPITGAPSTLMLRRSVLARNQELGVLVHGANAKVEASVIRDTQPDADGFKGRGMSVQNDPMTAAGSTLVMQSSLVAQNHAIGIFVVGSEATLEASVVRATQPELGLFGRGISAQRELTTGTPATLLVRSSLIDDNGELSVFVAGSDMTLETSVVRATHIDAAELGGRGVHAQLHDVPSTVLLKSSLIEDSHEAGVAVLSSAAIIDACIIRNTETSPGWGMGNGVMVVSNPGPASASIHATRIHQSAFAAVAAWGADVDIGGSALSCQSIDLNRESYAGQTANFGDLGGNGCGCPDATETCKALSAGLEPPTPAPINE